MQSMQVHSSCAHLPPTWNYLFMCLLFKRINLQTWAGLACIECRHCLKLVLIQYMLNFSKCHTIPHTVHILAINILENTICRIHDQDLKMSDRIFMQTEASPEELLMVGLTRSYPNVGTSSTINALSGSKKTTLSVTPGKTKHFQTLNITPQLSLVDCLGHVLPRYAASSAEMIAAGVSSLNSWNSSWEY